MDDLFSFAITKKWPPRHPDRIQLYSLPTPNGVKVSIMLEETGLPYEPHLVDFDSSDQKSPEFLSLNPNGKIPAIIDPDGPGRAPLGLFESGAILIYLAEKAGRLIPSDPARRFQCLQWLFFQVGHIGPMFGQFGHFFKYAKDKCDHPYPLERYTNEAKRLLGVLDTQLTGREFLVDEFSIADIATFPWVNALDTSYGGSAVLPITDFPRVKAWLDRCKARPSFQVGKDVTG